jgi:hypothetical protein
MLTLMLGLLGCNAEATDIEGIWALMLPNLQDVEEDCSEAISHNFTEGQVPEEDDEIETRFDEEIETTRSDQMTLVQIVRSDVNKDEAMLFAGARAYPGKETDKGSWLFTWEGSEITDRTQTHVDGYEYTELIDEARVASIRVNVSKDGTKGTWTEETVTAATYTETDAWSEEITEIDANGQMPSSTYLVVEIGSGSLTPLFNSRDRADCDGDACELELDISCTNEREFSAIKTGFDDETVYEDVAGAGQQAGT